LKPIALPIMHYVPSLGTYFGLLIPPFSRSLLCCLCSDALVARERCNMINIVRVLIPFIGMRGHPNVKRYDNISYVTHEPLQHHTVQKPLTLKIDVYR
jgi:hypothetical protein